MITTKSYNLTLRFHSGSILSVVEGLRFHLVVHKRSTSDIPPNWKDIRTGSDIQQLSAMPCLILKLK